MFTLVWHTTVLSSESVVLELSLFIALQKSHVAHNPDTLTEPCAGAFPVKRNQGQASRKFVRVTSLVLLLHFRYTHTQFKT